MRHIRTNRLTLACGVIGLAGCVAVVLGDIVAALWVRDVGMVSDTISNLAAGRNAWLMDTGLVLLSVGMIAVAGGLLQIRLDGWRWTLAALILGFMAVIVLGIALYDEYGDGDGAGGDTVHIRLVYALGLSFTFVPLLTARGLKAVDPRLEIASYAIAAVWFVLGPFLFAVPTGWDGLYERLVAAVLTVWLAGASWFLVKRSATDRSQ